MGTAPWPTSERENVCFVLRGLPTWTAPIRRDSMSQSRGGVCCKNARLTRCKCLLSSSVTGLNGSDAERDIAGLLACIFVQHLTFPLQLASDPLGRKSHRAAGDRNSCHIPKGSDSGKALQ